MAAKKTVPNRRTATRKKSTAATRGHFIGVGKAKAKRRQNGTAKDRLYYPKILKNQRGTAMETHIVNHFANLIDQYNAQAYRGRPKPMPQPSSAGQLRTDWKKVIRANVNNVVKDFMTNHNMRVGQAKKKADEFFLVHFGADPFSR